MKAIKIFLLFIFALSLTSCAIFNRTPPPPKAKLYSFKQTLAVRQVWSTRVGSGTQENYLKLTPALANGRLYAVSHDGTVTVLDALTGRKIWQNHIRARITSTPAVGDGLVVFGTDTGAVIALRQDNGAFVWQGSVGGEVLAAPSIARNLALVKAENDTLYALNIRNGKMAWSYQQPVPPLILRGGSAAKVSGSLAISGFSTGQVAAIRLSTGKSIWAQQIAEPKGSASIERMIDIDANPIIKGNRVYVATYQGKVVALNLQNGHVIWQHDLSVYSGMALSLGVLYATDANSHVWAFNAETGHVLWTQDQLFGRYLTGPAIIGNAIVVGDAEGYLHFLSMQDGHFVARVNVDKKGIIATPVIFNGVIYVYGNSGRLVAYRV